MIVFKYLLSEDLPKTPSSRDSRAGSNDDSGPTSRNLSYQFYDLFDTFIGTGCGSKAVVRIGRDSEHPYLPDARGNLTNFRWNSGVRISTHIAAP
jgi:hypothetical protein